MCQALFASVAATGVAVDEERTYRNLTSA